jgi:hypothetical protein
VRQNAERNTPGTRYRALLRFHKMKERCATDKRYAHVKVLVEREEFVAWFQTRDFEGASVDRIDSRGHYEFSNMQVISLRENVQKACLTFKDGFGVCSECHEKKPIGLFVTCNAHLNGKRTLCKTCSNARRSRHYHRTKRNAAL